jgi:ABC-type multidrug transport system fused ATPase/permease subunit
MDAVVPAAWRVARPVVLQCRHSLWLVLAWSALAVLPTLVSGRLVAAALDQGFLGGNAAFGLAMLACYGLALLLGAFAVGQAMTPMGVFAEALRDHLARLVVHGGLQAAVNRDEAVGAGAVARFTSQTETARQLVSNLAMAVTSAGLMVVAAGAGLFTLVPAVAMGLVPIIALVGAILVWLSRIWRHRYERALASEEKLAHETGRILEGLRDVASCAATARAAGDLDALVCGNAAATTGVADVGGARIAVIGLAGRVPFILLLVLAPRLISQGALSVGELVGAAVYLITGLEPAWRAIAEMLGNQGLEASTLVARLGRHGKKPEAPQGGGGRVGRYDLAMTGVTFRYGPQSDPVLDRFDLTIGQGEWLAVLGRSGIGKSTLGTVLAGMEEPELGTVRLGGTELTRLDRHWLRRTITLIPQEAYVFSGSLRENLTYLAPSAGESQLDDAVTKLGLSGLVTRCGGYDAVIRPGDLSDGERQLVALARTYLSPAQVVILDEATCHLDSLLEEQVETAFHLRPGALVVIAHRISSALRARTILVLDDGRTFAGTHETLVCESALYAELVHNWLPRRTLVDYCDNL